jgi:ABC-type multidrug transport system ATPase subunit
MQTMETGQEEEYGSNNYNNMSTFLPTNASTYEQTKLLLRKNNALLIRNKASTLMQIGIGFLFMVLLSVINVGLESDRAAEEAFSATLHMPSVDISKLKRCVPSKGKICYTFAYAPNDNVVVDEIVQSIISSNHLLKSLDLNEGKVSAQPYGAIGFKTLEDMQVWIFDNPNITNLAVAFQNIDSWNKTGNDMKYTLQVNNTANCKNFGLTCSNPMLNIGVPMQLAIDNALFKHGMKRYKTSTALKTAGIKLSLKAFPHPDLAFNQDAMKTYGAMFVFATLMFNFIIQLSHIVKEKELRLREAMKQMGLRPFSYWLSWFITDAMLDLANILVLCLTGWFLQLDFFVKNSFLLYFLLFLLTSLALTSAVFFFATLLRRAEQARNLGFALFIIFYIAGNGLTGYYFNSDSYTEVQKYLSLILPIPFLHSLNVLIVESSGSQKVGLSWSDGGIVPGYYPITEAYSWLILNFFMYLILTWYCDEVIPGAVGVKRPWYFPFTLSYWIDNSKSSRRDSKRLARTRSLDLNEYQPSADPTVRQEELAVESSNFGERNVKVVVKRLNKTFDSGISLSCSRTSFTAVNGVSYAIDDGELLCMLGHNGAGKTTTINMLTGMLPITSGDAYIFGHSAKHEMDSIREIMGICPQHDILWDQLTGKEHLQLFAGLKGMNPDEIEEEANKRLEQVELTHVANVQAQAYSGGMKRRLSLAIALIGDPKVVFLDEPTTGMDPVTRRSVWNMILKAKRGRIILLTTHSMEEADVLADRICIMSKGKIQALGSSLHLKQHFGTGYKLTVFSDANNASAEKFITDIVRSKIAKCSVSSALPGILEFQIPRQDIENMPALLKELKNSADDSGVNDISVSLTTLEEVFLNLSKAELDNEAEEVIPIHQQRDSLLGISEPETGMQSITFCSQTLALAEKTWKYQKRQSSQICCLVIFPIFSICLLLLLQYFVTKAESKNTYDMQCVRNKTLASILRQTPMPLEIKVGSPSLLNPGAFFQPYKEIVDYEIPISQSEQCSNDNPTCSCGTLNTKLPEGLNTWYSQVVAKVLDIQSCQTSFMSYLNRHQAVNNAFQWSNEYGGKNGSGFTPTHETLNLEDCKTTNKPKKRRLIGALIYSNNGGNNDIAGKSWKPNQGAFDDLKKQEDILIKCQLNNISDTLVLYSKLPIKSDLPQAGAKRRYTLGTGIVGNFTTINIPDYTFSTFENFVVQTIGPIIAAITKKPELHDIDVLCNFLAKPEGVAVLPLLQKYLENQGGVTKNLGMSLPYVCWVRESRDTIRNIRSLTKESTASIDKLLYDEWYGTKFGKVHTSKFTAYNFDYIDREKAQVKYTAWYNATGSSAFLSFKGQLNWPAIVSLMNNAIVKSFLSDGHGIQMTTLAWPQPTTAASLNPLSTFSIVDVVGGLFFPFVLFAVMPIVVSMIMYEKENRLREIMKMMGLKLSAYWFVTYILFYCEYALLVGVFWIAGALGKINFFSLHSSLIMFLIFFTWGHSLIAFSMLLTAFFSKTRTAVAVSFVLIFGFVIFGYMIFQTLQQNESSGDVSEVSFYAWQWLPPFAFMRIIVFVVDASTGNHKISLENWGNTPIPSTLCWLIVEWFVCIFLMYYFEKVLSVGYGVRSHPLFCCFRSFWCKNVVDKGEQNKKQANSNNTMQRLLPAANEGLGYAMLGGDSDQPNPLASFVNELNPPKDVLEEAKNVLGGFNDVIPDQRVRITGLTKKYKGLGGAPEKLAVKKLYLGVNENECLGLLGPNGAGKTTSISIMCGLFEPTAGDGLIKSRSKDRTLRVTDANDLNEIHTMMGVCPQHDVLWNDLTAREHVAFYGRLKGLSGQTLKNAIFKVLNDVKLYHVADKQAGKFSGGMKRRLSVANALIGSPRVVYLDEPSTGLDPSARRTLWDVITSAKGDGKAIVLTTHSMEEADALCDRIGIMSLGRLRCIGKSAELKLRYGSGFALSVATSAGVDEQKQVEEFIATNFPTAKLMMNSINGSYTYELPRNDVDLANLFETMERNANRLKINDWGITETTLEEVFFKATSEK